jgi:hypothetical protein
MAEAAVDDDATRGDLVTARVSLPGDGEAKGGEKAVEPRTAYIAQLRKEAAGALLRPVTVACEAPLERQPCGRRRPRRQRPALR